MEALDGVEIIAFRPRSLWSRVNVDRVELLLAAGRMRVLAWKG